MALCRTFNENDVKRPDFSFWKSVDLCEGHAYAAAKGDRHHSALVSQDSTVRRLFFFQIFSLLEVLVRAFVLGVCISYSGCSALRVGMSDLPLHAQRSAKRCLYRGIAVSPIMWKFATHQQ